MECRDAQFYLRLRRPGADELGPEVAADLDRHLAGCPRCAPAAAAAAALDRALVTAMTAVPVPAGLRNKLVAHVAAERGATVRRSAYRYAGLATAAALLVGIGLGFYGRNPGPDVYAVLMRSDFQAQSPDEAVRKWLTDQKLPPRLPANFDYGLLATYGHERVQGRDVPVVVFKERNGPGFAKVYAFRARDFDLKGLAAATASHCTAAVLPDQPDPGVTFVVVHTGPTLEPFLQPPGLPA